MTEQVRIQVTLEGRVQGVGFRYYVVERAAHLDLTGWVRNRWDGNVELVAEGDPGKIDALLSTLWKGPPSAFVTQVKTIRSEATGEFTSFQVNRTV